MKVNISVSTTRATSQILYPTNNMAATSLSKYAIVPPKHTSGGCFDTPEDLPKLPFGTAIACAKSGGGKKTAVVNFIECMDFDRVFTILVGHTKIHQTALDRLQSIKSKERRQRCGECPGCTREDCGVCVSCQVCSRPGRPRTPGGARRGPSCHCPPSTCAPRPRRARSSLAARGASAVSPQKSHDAPTPPKLVCWPAQVCIF